MPRDPNRRRLIDRDPATDEQGWLDELAEQGWVPEHRTGAPVTVNGRPVVRYAMIKRETDTSRVIPQS